MAFPTTELYLTRAEAALGRRLPEALRQRLLAHNGGQVSLLEEDFVLHPVFDETNRRTMSRTASHIVHETAQAREWADFPRGGIAVADCNANRLVLLEGSDEISFWDHETGELTSIPTDEVGAALSRGPDRE